MKARTSGGVTVPGRRWMHPFTRAPQAWRVTGFAAWAALTVTSGHSQPPPVPAAATATTPDSKSTTRNAEARDYQHPGIVHKLPAFLEAAKSRMTFPLSWTSGRFSDFESWRRQARAKVAECFQNKPPVAPWHAVVLAEEDRGTYVARKVVFNVTADSRVLALMTVPKGAGPFPAALLLHDHGARFDIGKEKVIRPLAGDPKLASAHDWSQRGYGGQFPGDELARRGYVCLAIDALNWGDRGGGGYDAQASIASNLMYLGMSSAGLTAWEDLRSAEFLAQQREVDPTRIAAVGWSLGAFRSWQVSAMSDHIAAGIAICWMSEVRALMSDGNNQATSSSAFTMLHPGLYDDLDYPDIASLACPKPMLFFNGRKDGLFPLDSVERAYAKLHTIWSSQGADDRLVTQLWDVGHQFNADMQKEAFDWLARVMAKRESAAVQCRPACSDTADAAVDAKTAGASLLALASAAPNTPPTGSDDAAACLLALSSQEKRGRKNRRRPKRGKNKDGGDSGAEVTWSLMHPVQPTAAYMREVIAAAEAYRVDSFEICGDVHASTGSLDGAIRFRDYPAATAALDLRTVDETIRTLREVVTLAHDSGRPVYYWHREVMVPRAVVERVPGLLDESGEFDLLGPAYQALVRSKIAEFFDHVPEMDGLVLTLTESDYSVIHNSDPKRYPPREVVRQLVSTFAEELHRRGKRFVLRSFGSIAQDYEDILAGAALVSAATPFEIETKITPYDFSPFLQFNRYLVPIAGHQLSAEYDSIGEFLSAGYLPAADPARVIDSVAYARKQGVDRHVIRVDRIGHTTFTSTQAINLLAFDRAIHDPNTTADDVWREWSEQHWPQCAAAMTAAMKPGIEMVKRTHFISGNVIFHAFPIHDELKWIQACGILSLFTPGRSLASHDGMWGILPEVTTPTRAALLQEKSTAVALADQGLRAVESLRDRLPPTEYALAWQAWHNAAVASRAIRAWTQAVSSYCDDMDAEQASHPALTHAVAEAKAELASLTTAALDAPTAPEHAAGAHEYGDGAALEQTVEAAYLRPIWRQLELFSAMFDAEFRERAQWRARGGVADFVVCGGFVDDVRVVRYMHAAHARLVHGRPARFAGNCVFPNGFIALRLACPAGGPAALVIQGDPATTRRFMLTIDGVSRAAELSPAGEFTCPLPPAETGFVDVRIQKLGTDYPALHGVATVQSQPSHHPSIP